MTEARGSAYWREQLENTIREDRAAIARSREANRRVREAIDDLELTLRQLRCRLLRRGGRA